MLDLSLLWRKRRKSQPRLRPSFSVLARETHAWKKSLRDLLRGEMWQGMNLSEQKREDSSSNNL